MAKIRAEIEVTSAGDGFATASKDAAQFKGAMTDLGKSGFASFEKLEDKVFDLQSALTGQRKQLLSVRQAQAELNGEMNKAGVGTLAQGEALKKLNAQEVQLAKSLSLSAAGYKNARQELGNMGARMRDTAGDAGMLLAMVGTRLPAGMDMLVLRSQKIQQALGAAFRFAPHIAAIAAATYAIAELTVHFDVLTGRLDTLRGRAKDAGWYHALVGTAMQPFRLGTYAVESEWQKAETERAAASAERRRQFQSQTRLVGLGGIKKIEEERITARTAFGVGRDQAELADLDTYYAAQRTQAWHEYTLGIDKESREVARLWMTQEQALRQTATDEIATREALAAKTGLIDDREKKNAQDRADFAIAQRNREIAATIRAAQNQAFLAEEVSPRWREYHQGAMEVEQFRRSLEGVTGAISPEDLAQVEKMRAARRRQWQATWSEADRKQRLETLGIEEQAGVAALPAWMRPMGQIAAEEKRQLRELDELRRSDLIGAEDYERRRAAYTIMAEQQRIEAVRSFGRELESMYERTIGSAKTFGEAMKNIWREVMAYYKRQAFDALAAILMGQPGATRGGQAGQGGLGGLGGIVLGVPGAGGGYGGIATPPWNPNPFMGGFLATGGVPYSTAPFGTASWPVDMRPDLGPFGGRGAGAGAGGSAAATSRGGLLDWIRQRAQTTKVAGISAAAWMQLGALTMAATYGHGRALSTIGGAAGGAMTGMAIGSMILPGIGTAIGAGVGAVWGGIQGWFGGGKGKEKTAAAEIADQGFADIFKEIDDYKSWRRDYASTLAAMNTTWGGMRNQWKQIWGGYGNRSEKDQRKYYDAAVAQVSGIEQARQNRRAVLGGGLAPALPLPEFQSGGWVRGAPGQPQLIVAHGGERVQTPAQAWSSPEEPAPVTATPATAGQIVKVLIQDPAALDRGMLVWLQRRGRAARAVTQ